MNFLIKLNWDGQKMTMTIDEYLEKLTNQLEEDISSRSSQLSEHSMVDIRTVMEKIEVLKMELELAKDKNYGGKRTKIITDINAEVLKLKDIDPQMLSISDNSEPVAINLGKKFLADEISANLAAARVFDTTVILESSLNEAERRLLLEDFDRVINSTNSAIGELNTFHELSSPVNAGLISQAQLSMIAIKELCIEKRKYFDTSEDITSSEGSDFLKETFQNLSLVIQNNIIIPTQPAHVISWGERFLDSLYKFFTSGKKNYESDETKQQKALYESNETKLEKARTAMAEVKGLLSGVDEIKTVVNPENETKYRP